MGTHSHVHRQLQTLWEAGFYPRASCLPKSSGHVSHRLPPNPPPHTHLLPAEPRAAETQSFSRHVQGVLDSQSEEHLLCHHSQPVGLGSFLTSPPKSLILPTRPPPQPQALALQKGADSSHQLPFLVNQVYLLKQESHLLLPTCAGGLSLQLKAPAGSRKARR